MKNYKSLTSFIAAILFIVSLDAQTEWTQIGGQSRDIGVGAHGQAWLIGWDAVPGGYSIHKWNGSSWEKKHGSAVRIDVDAKGNAWCVNDVGLVFYWKDNDWVPASELNRARDVGVGADGTVWIVGWDEAPGGYALYKWKSGKNWEKMPGGGVRIDVAPNGHPWVVNDAGLINQWDGSQWNNIGGQGRDITIGYYSNVWLTGWIANSAGDYPVARWTGNYWEEMDGGLTNISVGQTEVWGLNSVGYIYKCSMNAKRKVATTTNNNSGSIQADAKSSRPTGITYKIGTWSAWERKYGIEYRYTWGIDTKDRRYPAQVDAIFEVRNTLKEQWMGSFSTKDCKDPNQNYKSSPRFTLQPNELKKITILTKNCGTEARPFFRVEVSRTVRID
ncbi:MAG: hypothetical protein JNL70_04045 [Saprospiraceae bacterium]|nr:hypothetical protein [Saprospiraceae bacterium]